jgi:hypothetical protein
MGSNHAPRGNILAELMNQLVSEYLIFADLQITRKKLVNQFCLINQRCEGSGFKYFILNFKNQNLYFHCHLLYLHWSNNACDSCRLLR